MADSTTLATTVDPATPASSTSTSATSNTSTGRKRSPMWSHFTVKRDNERSAVCKHCCKEISRGGRSSETYNTTNLVNHLKTEHVSGPFKKYSKDVEAASKTNSLSDKS
uniref:BED-type domain-containing protein n=1 Tax=Amphimedon queenslandica TaxID=400682 RepID=A0A1X7UCS7_AMPQE